VGMGIMAKVSPQEGAFVLSVNPISVFSGAPYKT